MPLWNSLNNGDMILDNLTEHGAYEDDFYTNYLN